MNISLMIDILGYIASVLILLSFMMSNPIKLRIIAFIGAASFSVYGFLIHSYPTAIMNASVTIVNIYYLVKIFSSPQKYSACKASTNDDLVKNFLNLNLSKIKNIYKEFDINSNNFDISYILMCNSSIGGIVLGNKKEEKLKDVVLFVDKEFQNNQLYTALKEKLSLDNYKEIEINSKNMQNEFKNYIIKLGFKENSGYLVKAL